MRYLAHYEKYPIYEAAEGGYYYSGKYVSETERLSKRKAREEFEKIWEDCKAENLADYGMEVPDFHRDEHGRLIYPWIRISPTEIVRSGPYIGDGESYVIERKCGVESRGYQPYC